MDLSNNPFTKLASGSVPDYQLPVDVLDASALKTTKVIESILLLTFDKDKSVDKKAGQDVQVLGAVPYIVGCFRRACEDHSNTDCLPVVKRCEESLVCQLLSLLVIDAELDSKEHAKALFNLLYDAVSSDDPGNGALVELLFDKLLRLMEGDFCDTLSSEPCPASTLQAVRPMVDELLTRLQELKDLNQQPSFLLVNPFHSRSDPVVGTKERRLFNPERKTLVKLAIWFSRNVVTAQLLLEASFPQQHSDRKPRGFEFESGILGRLLVPSHMHWSPISPELSLLTGRSQQNQHLGEFFTEETPYKHVVEAEQRNISELTEQFDVEIHAIMTNLLRVGKTRLYLRSVFFHWLGACITANKGRAQLASSLNSGLLDSEGQTKELASDGFLNNLAAALVRLTGPLVTSPSPPLDKVWPVYANAKSAESLSTDAILPELYSETRLAATVSTVIDKSAPPIAASWKTEPISGSQHCNVPVLTELFFLAHAAVRIGWNPLITKHFETSQQLHRLETQLQAITDAAHTSESDHQLQFLRRLIRERSSRYLEQSTSLSMASRLRYQLVFALTVSRLLANLARATFDHSQSGNTGPAKKVPVGRGSLSDLPEYLVDNVVELISYLRRTKGDILEPVELDNISLEPLLEFSILFMQHTRALVNPHLRARLAEILETLLPEREIGDLEGSGASNGLGGSSSILALHRQQLMQPSSDKDDGAHSSVLSQAVAALLTAFVSIELSPGTGGVGSAGTAADVAIAAASSTSESADPSTGVDSQTTAATVGFEEKFHYRRPMYACLQYLHGKPFYDSQFQLLESEALEHIDGAGPPLFLQFLSLLVNDSVFLLDEAIIMLAQLKQKELEREAAGGRLTSRNDENLFVHTGRLARHHILLGLNTIASLRRVVSTCSRLVTHPILVDRIACMLNYLLSHLVGPKQRDLTVKDKAAYGFRPDLLVLEICKMYIILSLDSSPSAQLYKPESEHNDEAIILLASTESTQAFRRAVVADERSFSNNLLDQAATVLIRVGASSQLCCQFSEVVKLIRAENVIKQEDDLDVNNAPDDYVDPIMGDIMEDPVKLPSSGHIVDRKTIYRHLLNDSTDPFNRQPLAMSQVEPQPELKVAIGEWIASRRAQR